MDAPVGSLWYSCLERGPAAEAEPVNIRVDELANLIGVDFGAVRRGSRVVWVKPVHRVHRVICVAFVGFAVVVVWVKFVHIVYNLICVGLVRPYPSDRDYA